MKAIHQTVSMKNRRQTRVIVAPLLTEDIHLSLSSLPIPGLHTWLLSQIDMDNWP